MIQKCANPNCGSEFLYASRGRLFSFDITNSKGPSPGTPAPIREATAARKTIFFWLCNNCSPRFTVRFTPEHGFHAVALDENARIDSYYTEESVVLTDGQKSTSQLLDKDGSAEYFCSNCSMLAHGNE